VSSIFNSNKNHNQLKMRPNITW